MIAYSELLATVVPEADHRIAYGSAPLQFGELRLPTGEQRVPLVVLIHGGCWLADYDLAHTRGAAMALVREGFAVWTPEYRRLGDAGGGYPGTFDDVGSAVDFVRTLGTRFPRVDTSRVVVIGHSAGGQLALWIGSRTDANAFRPAGVVSLAGIADMGTYGAQSGSCNASVHRLMGGSLAEQRERYERVDPMLRGAMTTPTRIVHGANDPTVPVSQSRLFADRQRAAGGTVGVDIVPDAGHFDVVAPQSTAWPHVVRAIRSLLP